MKFETPPVIVVTYEIPDSATGFATASPWWTVRLNDHKIEHLCIEEMWRVVIEVSLGRDIPFNELPIALATVNTGEQQPT